MTNNSEIEIKIYTPENKLGFNQKEVADFFFKHLDQFGDEIESINASIDYALSEEKLKGGYVIVAREKGEVVGGVILNKTHMMGYHPENYLVYIAVHGNQRGKGLGKKLMKTAADNTEGGIALHVEPDNPAKFLYEKSGYTTKYLEYRLIK